MLCVWVYGCDPGRVSDDSRPALYQTLSIECPPPIFFLFFFVVFVLLLFSCSRWSFIDDVPLIFSCPADHVQYRVGNHVYYWVSSSSSTPLYCLRENISFDTLIRRSSRGHNSRKATQPSHCGTCLILLIFIAKRVQPSLPSSTLRSNFVYPRQISRSPRVGHCMS